MHCKRRHIISQTFGSQYRGLTELAQGQLNLATRYVADSVSSKPASPATAVGQIMLTMAIFYYNTVASDKGCRWACAIDIDIGKLAADFF